MGEYHKTTDGDITAWEKYQDSLDESAKSTPTIPMSNINPNYYEKRGFIAGRQSKPDMVWCFDMDKAPKYHEGGIDVWADGKRIMGVFWGAPNYEGNALGADGWCCLLGYGTHEPVVDWVGPVDAWMLPPINPKSVE